MSRCSDGLFVNLRWNIYPDIQARYQIHQFIVEIGTRPYATDVVITPVMTAVSPARLLYSEELPPGRFYARARRISNNCDGRSNPSREMTFEILP